MDKQLSRFDFLGKHDKVAQYVIMGKYDAGALKESVARKYAQYLKIIAENVDIYDFSIVASHTMDQELFQTLQTALYALKNTEILHSIKSSATGFMPRKASDYHNISHIMEQVDAHRE
ncbi:MAG: PhnD/SsuA/transferrin family substrate-binding protein [Gammaproteobacteria bacterium]|nr:PhnD/SsuA/transferrin family substrate-binding protein [Gammaproteobacteria bacterium]